jgi:hypothetical protein
MLWIDLALRWLHILSAITLAGGVLFWRFALLSALEGQPDVTRQEIAAAIRSRWSKLVMSSSGLLLITGLVNFMLLLQRYEFDKADFPGSKYHMLFGIKFLLSLAVFMLSALLAGRTAAAEKLRRNERMWLNITMLLAIAVVCLGGLLRAAVRHPKAVQSLQPDRSGERVMTDTSVALISPRPGE